MIRRLVSLVGGGLLALALFYLLALLVAPPKPDRTEEMVPTSMAMVDAPEEDSTPTPSSPAQPSPPPPPPSPPAAAAVEAAPAPSQVSVPDAATPQMNAPDVTLDDSLPELSEIQPEPEPEPRPEPQPAPQPAAPQNQETLAQAPTEAAQAPEPATPAQPPQGTQASPRDVGQLQPSSQVNPTYPRRAQRRGMEGYVEVSFIIQPDGSVDSGSLQVLEASPANVFDQAVEQAVSQWRFPPADDVRRATQRIQFELEG